MKIKKRVLMNNWEKPHKKKSRKLIKNGIWEKNNYFPDNEHEKKVNKKLHDQYLGML
jgi:hypothetical protein